MGDDMTKRRDTRPQPKPAEQLSLLDEIDADRDRWIRERLLRWHVGGDTGV